MVQLHRQWHHQLIALPLPLAGIETAASSRITSVGMEGKAGEGKVWQVAEQHPKAEGFPVNPLNGAGT